MAPTVLGRCGRVSARVRLLDNDGWTVHLRLARPDARKAYPDGQPGEALARAVAYRSVRIWLALPITPCADLLGPVATNDAISGG